MPRSLKKQRGLTLIELIVAFTIMLLLTAMAVPMAKSRVRREKERELRLALVEMRRAIDKYKDMADAQQVQVKVGTEGYPETLDILVEGVKLANKADGSTVRLLRRIPKDPFTGKNEWGMRSPQDDPKSQAWGGQSVFDVYSKTMEKAGDGTPYADW